MKPTAVLICILVVAMLVIPAAAGAEPAETREAFTFVATPEPTSVPATVPTTIPTTVHTAVATIVPPPEPTPEIIKPPTSLRIVTETTREPVTIQTNPPVTTIMPPGPQVGWLTILSTPSGASVSIDGKPAGVTPINGRELGSGTHDIQIGMAGYEPYKSEKTIGAGEQAAVDATLKPVPVTTVPTAPPTTHPSTVPTTHAPDVPTTHPTIPCVGCDKGWIRVNCNVNGATVSFDDLSSACTIAQGSCDTEVGTTSTPFRTFTVQKPGYVLFTGAVTVWPARGETVNLYATLNPNPPIPSYGTIQVNSQPSGAMVILDGGSGQYTPASFTSLVAGTTHNLRISMSGYQPYGTSAYVTAGRTTVINAYLLPNPPQPQTGSLTIVTSPAGADISVDGNYIAESPYVVTNLVSGSHTLRMHKAGYDEYLSTVTVIAGKQVPVSCTFTPQHPAVGSIEVASTPTGSALYLDGNYMGQTPQGRYFDLTSILQGYHTLLIRHTDFQDFTQSVYVKGGGVVTVNAKLTPNAPSPVPDTTGQIIIVSTPSGAELFLDNIFKGITPATLSDIPAGSHVVTVRQTGYTDATQAVTVTGGQSTPVALGLAVLPTTTKTPLTAVPVLGAFVITVAILAFAHRKH